MKSGWQIISIRSGDATAHAADAINPLAWALLIAPDKEVDAHLIGGSNLGPATPLRKIERSVMTTPPPEPDVCPILHLELGPLDLNLLGLRVELNQVVLDITAIPGPGNLLGNLLCAVAGLLDGVDLGAVLGNLLQALIDALIRLLEGIGGGAAPGSPAIRPS